MAARGGEEQRLAGQHQCSGGCSGRTLQQRGHGARRIDAAVPHTRERDGGRKDGTPDVLELGLRARRPEQRSQAGHVRRRHARAVVPLVLPWCGGGKDPDARRRDQGTAVRKRRQLARRREGSDGDQVVARERCRERRPRGAVVPRGGDEEHAALAGPRYCLRDGLALSASAPARVHTRAPWSTA